MSSSSESSSPAKLPPPPGPQPAAPGRGTYRLFRALTQRPLEERAEALRRQRPEDTPVGKDRRPQLSVTIADREQLEALADLLAAPLSVTVNLALEGLARRYELQEEAAAEIGAGALQQVAEHLFFERGLSFEEAVRFAAQNHAIFSWQIYDDLRRWPKLDHDAIWARYHQWALSTSKRAWWDYEKGKRPPPLEDMLPEGFRWGAEEAPHEAGREEARGGAGGASGDRRRRRVKVTPESEALLEAVAERLGSSRAGAYEVALRHLAYELGLLEGRR